MRQQEEIVALKLKQTGDAAARDLEKAARQKQRSESQQAEFDRTLRQRTTEFAHQLNPREQDVVGNARLAQEQAKAEQAASAREEEFERQFGASARWTRGGTSSCSSANNVSQAQAEARVRKVQKQAEQDLARRESDWERESAARTRETETRLKRELQEKELEFQSQLKQRQQELADQVNARENELRWDRGPARAPGGTPGRRRRRRSRPGPRGAGEGGAVPRPGRASATSNGSRSSKPPARIRSPRTSSRPPPARGHRPRARAARPRNRPAPRDAAEGANSDQLPSARRNSFTQSNAQAEAAHQAARQEWEQEVEKKVFTAVSPFKLSLARAEQEREETKHFAMTAQNRVRELEKKLSDASAFLTAGRTATGILDGNHADGNNNHHDQTTTWPPPAGLKSRLFALARVVNRSGSTGSVEKQAR